MISLLSFTKRYEKIIVKIKSEQHLKFNSSKVKVYQHQVKQTAVEIAVSFEVRLASFSATEIGNNNVNDVVTTKRERKSDILQDKLPHKSLTSHITFYGLIYSNLATEIAFRLKIRYQGHVIH